jgi:SNF2 family DNA or RNA helicase
VRTYGKVTLAKDMYGDDAWKIEPEPQVSIRLKRTFEKVHKGQYGEILLSATPENTRELEWFMVRYPMEMDKADRSILVEKAEEQREMEDSIASIMAADYTPPEMEMALPPREYQKVAAALAMRTGKLLIADDLGLGKTITALCTLTDPSNLPCLVVTLTHLPKQWESECNKFLPDLRTHIVKKSTPYDMTTITVGRGRKKREEKVLFPDVIIINYHKLRGWAETIAGVTKTVIFDECQELRRPESLKTQAATHVSGNSRTRIGLSATPIYNYGGEFFSVMNAIAPDSLGTKGEFLREWCHGVYGEKPSLRDPKAFGAYLRESGLMIRRTRSEVGRELEPLTKIPHAIDANTEELSKIEDSAAELAQIILAQGEAKKGMKMMAAEQLSNVLRQATGLAKAPYVADFVRMLVESGESVLLYGWHHEVYGIWQAKLKDLDPAMYTGKQSTAQKAESYRKFVNGESKILIMSLRAGAGLDGLQHICRTVVFGELDWSPGVHDQCMGRSHRDGQLHPVMAYYLLSEYGSDPIIADVLGVKRSQMQGIRDPNASLIERSNAGGHSSKKLAEAFMKQRGLEVKEPESATVLQFAPIEVDDGTEDIPTE